MNCHFVQHAPNLTERWNLHIPMPAEGQTESHKNLRTNLKSVQKQLLSVSVFLLA